MTNNLKKDDQVKYYNQVMGDVISVNDTHAVIKWPFGQHCFSLNNIKATSEKSVWFMK
jgi:hypothetical protein